MATKPEPEPTTDEAALVPKDQVLDMLTRMTEVAAATPEDITYNILAQYLAAESIDELLDAGTTVEASEILGAPITVKAVHWNQSKVKGAAPVYAVITAVRDGQPVTITCGSQNVMTQLFKADAMGWLPHDFVLDELPHETAQGFRPMFLRAVFPDDEERFKAKAKGSSRRQRSDDITGEEPF